MTKLHPLDQLLGCSRAENRAFNKHEKLCQTDLGFKSHLCHLSAQLPNPKKGKGPGLEINPDLFYVINSH